MKPTICVSIPVINVKKTLSLVKKAVKQEADLIEFRFDHLSERATAKAILPKLAKSTELKKIATNRARREGGKWLGEEQKRIELLVEAAKQGFEMIDLELTALNLGSAAEEIKAEGAELIISSHIFYGTPPKVELKEICEKEVKAGADVCKVVTKANTALDNLEPLNLLREFNRKPIVCFAMGRFGVPSRILSPMFGGAFTYACVDKNLRVAPGQLTVQELKQIYGLMGLL